MNSSKEMKGSDDADRGVEVAVANKKARPRNNVVRVAAELLAMLDYCIILYVRTTALWRFTTILYYYP
jgi:hypothetical protein